MTIKYGRMVSNFIRQYIQKVLGVQKSQIFIQKITSRPKNIERMRKKKIYISIFYYH